MRLSVNFIFILITCSVLRLDLVGAERGEKSAKNRQISEKGLEGQKYEEKFAKKTPQSQIKNKIVAKYKSDTSEEDSEESDEEPQRKKYKIKQKVQAEKRIKDLRKLERFSEEEEKENGDVKKGIWNKNFKNPKNTHFEKDGKAKFATSSQPGNKKITNQGKKGNEGLEEKEENKKIVKSKNIAGHQKDSVDKEGAKKYLKSKNDKNVKESKKVVKKSEEDNDDSSEESGLNSINKKKHPEGDLKPFAKVRKSAVVRRQKPKKVEEKIDHGDDDDDDDEDESDSDDTKEKKHDSDDDSTDTEESLDDDHNDDNESDDTDSFQCDSLEKNCDL